MDYLDKLTSVPQELDESRSGARFIASSVGLFESAGLSELSSRT